MMPSLVPHVAARDTHDGGFHSAASLGSEASYTSQRAGGAWQLVFEVLLVLGRSARHNGSSVGGATSTS